MPNASPPGAWRLGLYSFDAWLSLLHNTSLTITQHPVETGAAISDHSYVNPRRFTFNVAITDTIADSQFTGAGSRSVSAYQKLVELQESRTPLDLVTKYDTRHNVLIESIDVADDFRTRYALRATVTLVEIITVDTRTARAVSLYPQVTDQTVRGQLNTKSPVGNALESAKNWLGTLFR